MKFDVGTDTAQQHRAPAWSHLSSMLLKREDGSPHRPLCVVLDRCGVCRAAQLGSLHVLPFTQSLSTVW